MHRIRERNMRQLSSLGNRPRSTSITNTAVQRLWDQLHSKLWWMNWCDSRLEFRVSCRIGEGRVGRIGSRLGYRR
jgi:hypothetical protein